jgi:hypothetical protein
LIARLSWELTVLLLLFLLASRWSLYSASSFGSIVEKAKELKKRCRKNDARLILAHIEQDFDAEYGITWRTIEEYVEDYFQDKNKTKGYSPTKVK